MKRHVLFAATALVVAGLGLAAAAVAQTVTPAGKAQRMSLDANRDGAIDRGEAAKSPRLAGRFAELDRNADGRLDENERPQWKGKHRRHRGGIERADADGDGRISRAELEQVETGRGRPDSGRGGKRGVLAEFDTIDVNKDGHIVRGELRGWHQRMRPQREAEHAKRSNERFAVADLNRDGKLSRVEADEKMPRMAKQFAWMDENRDGFLSREESRSPRR